MILLKAYNMEKIDLILLSPRNQKIKKQYDAYVILYKDRLHYKVEFKAEELKSKEDESMGWEDVMNCWERIVKREMVVGVEIKYIAATHQNRNTENKWGVAINITGYNEDVIIWFNEEEAARVFMVKINDWVFPDAMPHI